MKARRGAPLEGNNSGLIIGVLKLGLALATLGVLSKLAHKLAGPGPSARGMGNNNLWMSANGGPPMNMGGGRSGYPGVYSGFVGGGGPRGGSWPVNVGGGLYMSTNRGPAGAAPRSPASGPSTPRPR